MLKHSLPKQDFHLLNKGSDLGICSAFTPSKALALRGLCLNRRNPQVMKFFTNENFSKKGLAGCLRISYRAHQCFFLSITVKLTVTGEINP
jgi:hypothetical protein